MDRIELARFIDHTVLKAEAVEADIVKLCDEAEEYKLGAVCIAPLWVPLAAQRLSGSMVNVCTVIGFPLGYSTSYIKGFEAAKAVADGAKEVDMVIPIGLLKAGTDAAVEQDVASVVAAAKKENADALVKVIIECCYLNEDEKRRACSLSVRAGADFVKTSTGFGSGGATIEDVRLMRVVVGEKVGVKAAGGIRTTEQALAMIEAGANRIGTSNGIAIVQGL